MDSISSLLTELLASPAGASGLILAVGAAYLGGILSSLTPCVYPMIPITVSVVGGLSRPEGERGPWLGILLRGLSYVLGMTIIYSFLGVAAGLTGRVFGTITNTSGWYLGLGLVLTVAALMMLEILPFDPAVWYQQLKFKFRRSSSRPSTPATQQTQQEITLAGAFFLGASSGFIAAPCTTPVLTAILAYIAKTQSVGLGLALMIAFSLGLGTLLLLIAAFTGALQILPRSGRWMKTVKIASGLILLGFAEYLIFQAGTRGGP